MLKPIKSVSKFLIFASLTGLVAVSQPAYAMPEPQAAAQSTSKATGVVKDEFGDPMIGATVRVANNPSQGGATNIDGEFSIANVKPGTKLKIESIGYAPMEVVWDGTPIDVQMALNATQLDEVVVTAMGIQRKDASLTYATQQIKGDDLMKVQDANFVTALNGKVSGVTISQSVGGAGGSSKILLRGNKSITGNNDPLIVVDGIPMTNQAKGSSKYSSSWDPTYGSTGEGGDALSLINPDDIESINVLKGANAAALYGSAAANGVLMITTKKGKEGKITVTLNSGVTFEKVALTPKLQNIYGNTVDPVAGTMTIEAWGPKLTDFTPEMLAYSGAKLTTTPQDKLDDFFQTGTTWNNAVAISGGTEKITTYFSFANANSKGVMPDNHYNRNTFAFRQSYKLFDNKLRIDVAMNYVYAKTQNRYGGGTFLNPLWDLYLAAPNVDMAYYKNNVYNPNGEWESNSHGYHINGVRVTGTTTLKGPQQNWAYSGAKRNNPYWLTGVNRSYNTEERAYGYATANYEIIPGLNAQARVNLDRSKLSSSTRRYATTQNAAAMEDYGVYMQDRYTSNDVYVDALLSYNKSITDWDFSATAGWSGHTVTKSGEGITYSSATYYKNGMEKLPTLINFFEPRVSWDNNPNTYSRSSDWDRGLFFTGQVGWKDMVFVEGSYRQDWYRAFKQFSDRGTPDNYGYWSIGGNTLVHKYVKMPDFITYLKVRASYAEVGNSIPNIFYSLGSVDLGTGTVTGSGYGYFANPRPEKSKSTEAGFDISFFNSALMWDLTYYHTDLTNSYFIAPSSSGKATPVNTGLIRNQGIETTLTYDVYSTRDLLWKTGFNFSYNHNRIIKTYRNAQGNPARMEQNIAGKILVRYEEGGEYGDMYAYDFRRNEDGTIYISKNTGTPQLSPRNLVYLGNMNSKYQLGWSNTLTWKDLSLYFLISGRIGGKVISFTEADLDYYGMSERTAAARLNAEKNNIVWTSADGLTSKPGMYIGDQIVPVDEYYRFVGQTRMPSEYIYDATNFRLSELSLGYTFRNLFKGAIKSINLSFVGRNLFFLYKKSPIDPELSLSTANGLGGVDVFNAPSTRSYGINLKVEF